MHPIYRHTMRIVDLKAIARNTQTLCDRVQTTVMAVVKADAYGHGLVPAAHAAMWGGARALAVAVAEEGVALRESGISVNTPILILGGINERGARAACAFGLTATIYDMRSLQILQSAAERTHIRAEAHMKLDTGMNRIGAKTEREVCDLLNHLKECPGVRLTGAFTHFADTDDADYTREQFKRFQTLIQPMPGGITVHAAASAASLRYPGTRLDMVREGISLYGALPNRRLIPAMRWVTSVTFVKSIEPGETVSYDRTFTAERPMRVATLSVGYGDGYHRACSGRGYVLLHGKRARILGRVCMDQTMVDVTDNPDVMPGDEAVLLGKQGDLEITAEELGAFAGTISYEVLLSSAPRVPRVYLPCGNYRED